MEDKDKVVVAPGVLIASAVYSATQVDGVARMGDVPVDMVRLLRGNVMSDGIVLEIDDNRHVNLELYIVVQPDVNMLEIGKKVQQAVARSIQEVVGMEVASVNVHIENVNYSTN